MKAYNNKHRGGLTLTEILIAVALFSTIVILVSSFFSFISRTYSRVDNKTASTAELERFLLRIDQELRSASGVNDPGNGGQSDIIRFHDAEGSEITYSLTEEGKIIRTDQKSRDNRSIASNIKRLSFSRYNRGLVQILVVSENISLMTAVHVWNLL